MPITPAAPRRAWMDETPDRFAYRCLPLVIANQAGWVIGCGHTVRATWNGDDAMDAVTVEHLDGGAPHSASSHFGCGILTFHIPYLFRTPPGWNVLARGPANAPKDGIAPLEGIVETDWTAATFTMNWKFTRARHTVEFARGEPICMIVPQRRGELEAWRPEIRDLAAAPGEMARHTHWAAARDRFNAALRDPDSAAAREGWQKHYMRGQDHESEPARPTHQTSLRLSSVTDSRKS